MLFDLFLAVHILHIRSFIHGQRWQKKEGKNEQKIIGKNVSGENMLAYTQ